MNPCRGTGKEYNPCPSQVVKRELAACDPFPVSKLKPRDGDLYHESYPRVIQTNLIPRSSLAILQSPSFCDINIYAGSRVYSIKHRTILQALPPPVCVLSSGRARPPGLTDFPTHGTWNDKRQDSEGRAQLLIANWILHSTCSSVICIYGASSHKNPVFGCYVGLASKRRRLGQLVNSLKSRPLPKKTDEEL